MKSLYSSHKSQADQPSVHTCLPNCDQPENVLGGAVSDDALDIKHAVSFGPFRLSAAERLLKRNGVPLQLGSRALDILVVLVDTPEKSSARRS
jgi:DNA-binding response OmpR family regulator